MTMTGKKGLLGWIAAACETVGRKVRNAWISGYPQIAMGLTLASAGMMSGDVTGTSF